MTNAEQTAAINAMHGEIERLTQELALLGEEVRVITQRIAPIAPQLDDSGELGAVVKSSDLLGTDEGAE